MIIFYRKMCTAQGLRHCRDSATFSDPIILEINTTANCLSFHCYDSTVMHKRESTPE